MAKHPRVCVSMVGEWEIDGEFSDLLSLKDLNRLDRDYEGSGEHRISLVWSGC